MTETPVLVESTTSAQLVVCTSCTCVRTRELYEYAVGGDSYAPCCLFCLPPDTRVTDEFELHEKLSDGRLHKYYGSAAAMYQIVTRYRLACINKVPSPAYPEHVIKILTYLQWQRMQKLNEGGGHQHNHDQVSEQVERILVLS